MMELLNNVWVSLSTPNEFLISLISIPATFIEIYIALKLFTSILNIRTSIKQRIYFVLSCAVSTILCNLLLPNPYNSILVYILTFIFSLVIFRLSILKTALTVTIPIIAYTLIYSLILNPYLTLCNISYKDVEVIPIYRIIYLILIYFILFSLIIVIQTKKISLDVSDDIDNKNKKIIISNLLFGLFALIVQALLTFYYIDTLPVHVSFLSFLSLLVYFGISIYSLNKVMKLVQTTKKLESAEEFNKTLRILHDNVRGFKHDFDNIVSTIGGYVRTNDMPGLKKYYLELEDDCQKVNNLYVLNPDIINNPGIYNLLTSKYYSADSKDIKLTITCLLDINALNVKIYEFARILGILLDNAIDASEECDEKIINVIFRDDNKHHRKLIIVENTYKDKNVDTVKIFGKGISSKPNHTGLGLWEVQKILKKNKNLALYTNKSNKYFIQQLEIYDKDIT